MCVTWCSRSLTAMVSGALWSQAGKPRPSALEVDIVYNGGLQTMYKPIPLQLALIISVVRSSVSDIEEYLLGWSWFVFSICSCKSDLPVGLK